MAGLYMLTEHSPFMMSFVFLTEGGRHSGVTEEVYQKIAPEACMWCAPPMALGGRGLRDRAGALGDEAYPQMDGKTGCRNPLRHQRRHTKNQAVLGEVL